MYPKYVYFFNFMPTVQLKVYGPVGQMLMTRVYKYISTHGSSLLCLTDRLMATRYFSTDRSKNMYVLMLERNMRHWPNYETLPFRF